MRAHGSITQDKLHGLHRGVTIDGMHYGPIEAALDRVQGSNVWLTLGIREGKNREVRNVLGHLGLSVTRLIRVSFGPFRLGELAEGQVEEVRTRVLREQLGDKLAKLSGADFSAPRPPAPRKPRHDEARQDEARHDEMRPVAQQTARRSNIALHPIMPGASTKKASSHKRCIADFMVRAASARKFRRETNRRRLIY